MLGWREVERIEGLESRYLWASDEEWGDKEASTYLPTYLLYSWGIVHDGSMKD